MSASSRALSVLAALVFAVYAAISLHYHVSEAIFPLARGWVSPVGLAWGAILLGACVGGLLRRDATGAAFALAGVALAVAGMRDVPDYHAANHDEQVFGDDAMTFDVRRAERMPDLYNQLRSFGIGQHFCIGSHLARLELKIMFEEIIPRLRNPQFKGEPQYVRSFFVNAMKSMDITFDPEVADANAA